MFEQAKASVLKAYPRAYIHEGPLRRAIGGDFQRPYFEVLVKVNDVTYELGKGPSINFAWMNADWNIKNSSSLPPDQMAD